MWTNPVGPQKENWETGMAMQNWKFLKKHPKKILMHRNWEWSSCFCCQTSIKWRALICEPELHHTEGNPNWSILNIELWFGSIYEVKSKRKTWRLVYAPQSCQPSTSSPTIPQWDERSFASGVRWVSVTCTSVKRCHTGTRCLTRHFCHGQK